MQYLYLLLSGINSWGGGLVCCACFPAHAPPAPTHPAPSIESLSPCFPPRPCRGSYLGFTGSRAFLQVLASKHNFLHRQVRASCLPALPGFPSACLPAPLPPSMPGGVHPPVLPTYQSSCRCPLPSDRWWVLWRALHPGSPCSGSPPCPPPGHHHSRRQTLKPALAPHLASSRPSSRAPAASRSPMRTGRGSR